jgi:hypothetical protein
MNRMGIKYLDEQPVWKIVFAVIITCNNPQTSVPKHNEILLLPHMAALFELVVLLGNSISSSNRKIQALFFLFCVHCNDLFSGGCQRREGEYQQRH